MYESKGISWQGSGELISTGMGVRLLFSFSSSLSDPFKGVTGCSLLGTEGSFDFDPLFLKRIKGKH
jgi:hypothetical protein